MRKSSTLQKEQQLQHDAMLWTPLEDQKVRCDLCGHRCVISEGELGICYVRANVAGSLKSLNYGAVVAMHVDPIEKKPLFHFLPGSLSLSVAAVGCNFQCQFCQNWQISQSPKHLRSIEGQATSPLQIVAAAAKYDCASISYTYTEPTVFFELAYDTARLAHQQGIRNCFVSNGFMTPAAVNTIAPYLDAINVDLKSFSDETYQRLLKARLAPVLTCMKELVKAGVWVEVTTLIVPGMNDSDDELRQIAEFIANDLGPDVPWHVSRFHGEYKMTNTPATPLETLDKACQLGAEAGLKYVYCGNVTGCADECTYCPSCEEVLIDRVGYAVRNIVVTDGHCPDCNEPIEGIWKP